MQLQNISTIMTKCSYLLTIALSTQVQQMSEPPRCIQHTDNGVVIVDVIPKIKGTSTKHSEPSEI